MRFVVVGNSKHLSEIDFLREASLADQIIAADGGANHCLRLRITPSIIIGDLDSISKEARDFFTEKSSFEFHRQDKDDLDLVLACQRAEQLGATQINVFGWNDERIDYGLSSILGLLNMQAELLLWTETSKIHLLNAAHPELQLTGPIKISVLNLGGRVSLKTQGLRWELNWSFEGAKASQSNEIASKGTIHLIEGSALVVLER